MKCHKCQHMNRDDAKFCEECGEKLKPRCPKCDSELRPNAKFCDECGTKVSAPIINDSFASPKLEDMNNQLQRLIPKSLAEKMHSEGKGMEGETRLVTAMFADISGFTPASEKMSPEELVDLVNLCFKEIVDTICIYEGSVNRFIGDCVLAFFGVPIAHENDPERAILAALEMRDKVMKLNRNISVGINTGVMYIGSIGSDLHVEYTAEGYQINLAKRLQEFADAGQIVIGESTYRFTQRAFAFDKLSPLSMKGISQSIQAYSVIRPLERPEKLRGIEGLQARMIGREREFMSLIDSTNSLIDEHRGQIINIVGEAGIGKSRLVRELREYITNRDIQCLEGRCISIGQSMSFWPFIDMMRVYLGISGEDNETEVADKLIQNMTELFGQGADGIIPYVGHMMSVKLPDKYLELIRYAAPEQIRHQILLRMRDVFKMIASKKPLVVILEDVHWADELSLALMWVLMDELVATQMMLIGIHRPEQEHGSWQIDMIASKKHIERYTPIYLKPLTIQQTEMMIGSLLQIEDMPSAIRSSIIEKTDGNPFFVEEMVRWLIEQGLIFKDGDHWKAKAEIAELTVPDTIQSVILSRIDRLHEEVKYVLQCASVIGRVFRHRLLAYLSGQGTTLESHITELEKNELVYKDKIVPELEYAFKHALTQETTYQGMLNRQRSIFHERIAKGIEDLYQDQLEEYYEQLAYHYTRCNNQNKAVEYLIKSGDKAVQRYSNEEALRYYQSALELSKDDHKLRQILNRRSKLLLNLYRGSEAILDYEKLVEYAKSIGDKNEELNAIFGLSEAYHIISYDNPDNATIAYNLCQKAYEVASEIGNKPMMARILSSTQDYYGSFGLITKEQAFVNAQKALSMSLDIGDDDIVIDSKFALFFVDRTVERGMELVKLLQERHDLIRLKEVFFLLTWSYGGIGDFRTCIECCDSAYKLAEEIGVPPVMYPTIKAINLMRLGEYSLAWESIQREVADPEHKLGMALKDYGIGVFFLEIMDFAKASEILKSALEQAQSLKRNWLISVSKGKLAMSITEMVKQEKIPGDRLNELREPAINLGNTIHLGNAVGSASSIINGEIELYFGNTDEAISQVKQTYLLAEEKQARYVNVSILELHLRILLKLGEFDDVIRLADDGISKSIEMGYIPMLWRIHLSKAQAFEKLDRLEEAKQEYKASAEIIKELAENISEEEFRQSFMSNPLIAKVLKIAQRDIHE